MTDPPCSENSRQNIPSELFVKGPILCLRCRGSASSAPSLLRPKRINRSARGSNQQESRRQSRLQSRGFPERWNMHFSGGNVWRRGGRVEGLWASDAQRLYTCCASTCPLCAAEAAETRRDHGFPAPLPGRVGHVRHVRRRPTMIGSSGSSEPVLWLPTIQIEAIVPWFPAASRRGDRYVFAPPGRDAAAQGPEGNANRGSHLAPTRAASPVKALLQAGPGKRVPAPSEMRVSYHLLTTTAVRWLGALGRGEEPSQICQL